MNKEEGKKLLDEIRHNDSVKHKVIRIAKGLSVLEKKDLYKTRIFGVLSKDFPENRNIGEKLAFFEFLTNNLTLKDFRKKIEHLEYKIKGLTNNHAGALLELIIIDTLSRKGTGQNEIIHRKGPTEIDGEYKVDLITQIRRLKQNLKFGVQLTISDGLKARKKSKKIEKIVHKIDDGVNGAIFGNKMSIDSMIYIKLSGVIAEILGNSSDLISIAITKWKKENCTGNILDYIEDKIFVTEIHRFCDIYLLIINYFLSIIENENQLKGIIENKIILPTGETIDIKHSKRDQNIYFSISKNGRQLFSMKFYLNKHIIEKINTKSEKEEEINIKQTEQFGSDLLISEYKNNESARNKTDELVKHKAVLEKIDLVKTRIWGLLSKGFLEKRNVAEIRAFHEYISSKFSVNDFTDLEIIEHIIIKDETIFNCGDGIILEYIIIEELLRMNSGLNIFDFYKGSKMLDAIKKTDFITSYLYNGKRFKIGAQMTAIQDEKIKNHKIGQVKSVLRTLDKGVNENINSKLDIDSLIFIEFLGTFWGKGGKNSNQLKDALFSRKENEYIGNVVDYIDNTLLQKNIQAFSTMFPSLLEIIFQQIQKKSFGTQNISLNKKSLVKVVYKKNGFIKITVFNKKNAELFKLHFTLNQKLLNKINGNLQDTETLKEVVNL